MRGHTGQYDWAAYYAAAYESERKKNIVLAGRIADAQRRQADLEDHLAHIASSPFWKASAPFRKLYRRLKNRPDRMGNTVTDAGRDAALARYREELDRQTHPYLEWIKQENNSCDDKITSVTGWDAVKIPNTDIIILTYGRGFLDGSTFNEIKTCFNNNPSCLILYTDEDFYWEKPAYRMCPWLKPDYSPDTLLAFNYWGHLVAVRAGLLSGVLSGDAADGKEQGSQAVRFYDLCLRLEEAAAKRCMVRDTSIGQSICHLDRVLYHRAYEPSERSGFKPEECEDPAERFRMAESCLTEEMERGRYLTGAGKECVAVREAALARRGIRGSLISGQEPELYHVVYDTSISGRERCVRAQSADGHIQPHHVVSVVIPSRDHPDVLERCLTSFRQKTDYQYYEWIVVDNGSSESNRQRMEELQHQFGFTYLYEQMPFNFSRMCNMGAAKATGDLILFLNDDIEIIEQSWLRRMTGQALQPQTGAVGAKLWYAGTQDIQHAGITNMQIGPSHKLVTFPDDRDYYYGRNRVVYDMIGVTGACLMVSREKYEEVGGFDETMAVAYNDVEFCFKLIEAGYYNVQRNDAVLYHHESLSRGADEQDEAKWERLLDEKEALYDKHPRMRGQDSCYHRALIDNASDYRCNYKFPYEDHLYTVVPDLLREEQIAKASPGRLRLTVDRAGIQNKIHADEPDILWIMGWCYAPGLDNACYDKYVLLRNERQDSGTDRGADTEAEAGAPGRADYIAVPSPWHRRDVETVIPTEKNIGLAGFALRIRTSDLQPGTYRVGMLYTDGQGGRLITWSDVSCTVPPAGGRQMRGDGCMPCKPEKG